MLKPLKSNTLHFQYVFDKSKKNDCLSILYLIALEKISQIISSLIQLVIGNMAVFSLLC